MNAALDLVYQEVSLVDVMQYFAKGFNLKEGQTIREVEWFMSPDNQRVLFRMVVKNPIAGERPKS